MEKEIIKDYLNGETGKNISNKYNISIKKLYRILKDNSIDKSKRGKGEPRPPKYDLTGQKFAHLTVIKMAITEKSKDRTWRCICRCDCGRKADINTNCLMRGLSKTCGHKDCEYHRQDYTNNGKNNVKFTGYEELSGQKWSAYKCGAKRRKIEFNITIQYAWNLFINQNRKCALTGEDIFFGKTNTSECTASLDRIDSSKGYIEGNLHWVHKDVNLMKMALSIDRLYELCKKIVKNDNVL